MKKLIVASLFFCSAWGAYAQENAMINDVRDSTMMNIHVGGESISDLNESIASNLEIDPLMLYENSYMNPDFYFKYPLGYTHVFMGTLKPNLHYTVTGNSDVLKGITVINSAAFDLYYSQDRFLLNAGSSLWRYESLGRQFKDVAFYADASYEVLPWLTLGAYGQYSLFSRQNFEKSSLFTSPTIPFTGYGVYSKVMFNSNFGVGGSVGRQFNPIKNKWEPTYGFGPIIEFKRKKR